MAANGPKEHGKNHPGQSAGMQQELGPGKQQALAAPGKRQEAVQGQPKTGAEATRRAPQEYGNRRGRHAAPRKHQRKAYSPNWMAAATDGTVPFGQVIRRVTEIKEEQVAAMHPQTGLPATLHTLRAPRCNAMARG